MSPRSARPEARLDDRGPWRARRIFCQTHARDLLHRRPRSGSATWRSTSTRERRATCRTRAGLINADETLSVVKNGNAADPDGKYPAPGRPARSFRSCSACFPARGWKTSRPISSTPSPRKTGSPLARSIPPCSPSCSRTSRPASSRETGFQYGDLNHLQFNPVDPNLLLYCHEGTWHELDRTWTIRTDGSQMRLMHQRTMDMEINGHEWWSWDGKTVWFDLQTPRSQDFWIAGVNMATGKEDPVSPPARLVGRALQQLARRHALRQRRRRPVAGRLLDRRHVDQSPAGAAGRDGDARKAGQHVQAQLRDRPRRRRAQRPHHARQEMGRLHRPVRAGPAARVCGRNRW